MTILVLYLMISFVWEDAWNLDNICESIDKTGEDFNVEVIGAEQVRPLLAEVYGVDEFGNVIYVEDDKE